MVYFSDTGKYEDISCALCGVNARYCQGKAIFYKGLSGLARHFELHHRSEDIDALGPSSSRYRRVPVEWEDVRKMQDGQNPLKAIPTVVREMS